MAGLIAAAAPAGARSPWGKGVAEECRRSDYGCTSGGYQGSEPWGYYTLHGSRDAAGRLHNCTTYAAYQMARAGVPNPGRTLGHAKSWGDSARSLGWIVSGDPAVGAIAQWNDGAGHVARVERVDAGGITVTDDNWGTNVTTRRRITRGSVGWPDNFLHGSSMAAARFYGDWDGNGTVTAGVARRVNGQLQWHLRNGQGPGPADMIFSYGNDSDIPVVGNWDGVGGDTIGVVRKRTDGVLEWHLRNYNSAGLAQTVFGYGSSVIDQPVVGNWDGVGGDTVGVVRDSGGALQWHLRNYNSPGWPQAVFGYGSSVIDIPVVGNWDGVGGDTIGVARRLSNGVLQWHLRNYNSPGWPQAVFGYGSSSIDAPVVGNWDGVGGDTVGVVRDSGGALQWHLRNYNSPGWPQAVFGYGGYGEVLFM